MAVSVSLALVSVAVIAFQLVIMQMLSIMQWYHFAYMVISMAMLGFGAAGTVLSLAREWFIARYTRALPLLLLLTGPTMILAARIATGAAGFDTYLLFYDPQQIGLLIGSYLVLSLPFFAAGLAISLAFTCEVGRIHRLYFANLAGSGAGAVMIVILLSLIRLEHLAPALAILPVAAALIVLPASARARWVVAAFLVCASLVILHGFMRPVDLAPSQYKDISAALQLPGARVVHRSDGPYGRVEVVRSDAQRMAPGLSLVGGVEPPVRDVMFVNGDSFGVLLGRGIASGGHVLDATTRVLPYVVRETGRVLVMDAATGVDVSHALARGAAAVTAVEENRQTNRLLTELHPDWIESIYLDPRVELHELTSRTYLSTAFDEPYDLIVAPVLGAFGADTGVASLAERYDLTVEAFMAAWDRLAPEGMITTTVWVDSPPRALPRLIATWREVLERRNVAGAAWHIAAVRSWATVTLVLSRSPFTPAEVSALREFCERLGFDPLLYPGVDAGERDRYNRLPDRELFDLADVLVSGDPRQVYSDYRFGVVPASDNRPYFFQFLRPGSLTDLASVYGLATVPYLELGTVLAGLTVGQIAAAAVLLVVLPIVRLPWRSGSRRWTVLTFAGLGIGFMFFEIVLIQHLVLYLGRPVYATATVLAVLLIASGIGSLSSGRIAQRGSAMRPIGLAIALLILLYAVVLMPIVRATIAWPSAGKAVVVIVVLAVPAVLMGMMFPLGLSRLAGACRPHIPWACAIDSALSVSATAIATITAAGAGFRIVLVVAAAAYALSALCSSRLGR